METVLYALNDANEQVRYSALSGALGINLKLPEGTVENLMQYDRLPFVRSLALKAIAEQPGVDRLQVKSMAEAALADPHPNVRAEAKDILTTLEQPDAAQDSPWASTAFPRASRENSRAAHSWGYASSYAPRNR